MNNRHRAALLLLFTCSAFAGMASAQAPAQRAQEVPHTAHRTPRSTRCLLRSKRNVMSNTRHATHTGVRATRRTKEQSAQVTIDAVLKEQGIPRAARRRTARATRSAALRYTEAHLADENKSLADFK